MTEVLRMTGKAYWCKVYEPDTAFGASNYKLDFVPDEESMAKFKASGIQKAVKEDEKGKYFQLVRPDFKLIKGAVINFTGPVIEDKEGKVIVDYINKDTGRRVYSYDAKDKNSIVRRGTPILIGNGSTVEVKVAVYDTFKGKGHRLETVRVLDLIEYKRDGEYKLPEMSDLVAQVNAEADKAEGKNKGTWQKNELDDEIPF
jgi:hypothetical protein